MYEISCICEITEQGRIYTLTHLSWWLVSQCDRELSVACRFDSFLSTIDSFRFHKSRSEIYRFYWTCRNLWLVNNLCRKILRYAFIFTLLIYLVRFRPLHEPLFIFSSYMSFLLLNILLTQTFNRIVKHIKH